ncbi:MAG TPA: hypothetical protein VEK57_01775 [Thermoanaerobaculia bacterium]|nr:hypothetical protein [Thermoanaerobaculia bacterium]
MALSFRTDELFPRLRNAGFPVSVVHYLRAYRLLQLVDPDTPADELRLVLRPLFATSAEQQKKFDEVFRALLKGDDDRKTPGSATDILGLRAVISGDAEAPPQTRRLSRRTKMLIAVGLAVLLIAAVALWPDWSGSGGRTTGTDTASTTGRTGESGQTDSTASGTTSSTAITTVQGTSTAQTASPTTTTSTTTSGTAGEGDRQQNQDVLALLLALLLILGGLTDTFRWLLRRYAARDIKGRRPPYEWPRPPDADAEIFDSQPLQQAVNALRGRLAGERMEVDIRRTIRDTIQGGGFPRLRYAGSAQSPEYIALVDRLSPDDHLGTYFVLLVNELVEQGAAVDAYTFTGDPRVCTAADGTTVDLARLRAARPTAKLLLFSDGGGLVDARTGAMRPWVEHDLGWDQRALLVPAIPHQRRLDVLSALFKVERADAGGLLRLALHFAAPSTTEARPASDAPLSDSPSVREVRRALSPEVFRWLTACAAQRSLDWSTTLALGRIAHPALTETAVLELVRIGWFRRGSIPEEIRWRLWALLALDPELARTAEETVARELRRASTEAPRRSFAAEILLVEAIAHEMLARHGKVEPLPRELQLVDPALVRRDEVLPRLLDPERGGATPSRWSRLRFRGGFAALGPSAMVATAAAAVLAALLLLMTAGSAVLYSPPTATDTSDSTATGETAATETVRTETMSTETSSAGPDGIGSSTGTSDIGSSTDTSGAGSTADTSGTGSTTDTTDTGSTTDTTATTDIPGGVPVSAPVGCIGQANPVDEGMLAIVFSGCGEAAPRSGEVGQLSAASIAVPMEFAFGLTLNVVDYAANRAAYVRILQAPDIDLVVRNVRIPIRFGIRWSPTATSMFTGASLPCFARIDLQRRGQIRFSGPCTLFGNVKSEYDLLVQPGDGTVSAGPMVSGRGRRVAAEQVLLLSFRENGEFLSSLQKLRVGTVSVKDGPQTSRYRFVVSFQNETPRDVGQAQPFTPGEVSIVSPTTGVTVPLGSSQQILLQWTAADGATSYALRLQCNDDPEQKVTTIGPAYAWAAKPGVCNWWVVAQSAPPGGSLLAGPPADGIFTVMDRAAFEMSSRRTGNLNVTVTGTVAREVTALLINENQASLVNGRFRVQLTTGRPLSTVVGVAALENGATIIDTEVVD